MPHNIGHSTVGPGKKPKINKRRAYIIMTSNLKHGVEQPKEYRFLLKISCELNSFLVTWINWVNNYKNLISKVTFYVTNQFFFPVQNIK